MALKMEDTEQVLKLATLAAQSAIKEESKGIFKRINEVVDRLSTVSKEVATVTERVESSDDRATSIVREEVHACLLNHKKDRRFLATWVVSLVALSVAIAQGFGFI